MTRSAYAALALILWGCAPEAPPAAKAPAPSRRVPRNLPYTPEHFWSEDYPGKPAPPLPPFAAQFPGRPAPTGGWDALYREAVAGLGSETHERVETWTVNGRPRKILRRGFERGQALIVLTGAGIPDIRHYPRVFEDSRASGN